MTEREVVVSMAEDGTPLCPCHRGPMVQLGATMWQCATTAMTALLLHKALEGYVPETFRGPNYKGGG